MTSFVAGVVAYCTVMHEQYSNGVTIWRRMLQRLVNTLNVHNSEDRWCAYSRDDNKAGSFKAKAKSLKAKAKAKSLKAKARSLKAKARDQGYVEFNTYGL